MTRNTRKDNVVNSVFRSRGFDKYYNLVDSDTACEHYLGASPDELGIYKIGDETPYGDVVALAIAKSLFFNAVDEEEQLGILDVIRDGGTVYIGVMTGDNLYEPVIEEIEELIDRM